MRARLAFIAVFGIAFFFNVTTLTAAARGDVTARGLRAGGRAENIEIQPKPASLNVSQDSQLKVPIKVDLAALPNGIGGRRDLQSYPSGYAPPNWQARLKLILNFAAGFIPSIGPIPVGSIMNLVLNMFWPTKKVSIWDQVKTQVSDLVDAKILAYEMQSRQEQIDGLRLTLVEYENALIHERGALMAAMLSTCNTLQAELFESKNSLHLWPLTAVVSVLHTSILRERLLNGTKMYLENNTVVWKQELDTAVDDYFTNGVKNYADWIAWRSSQLKVTAETYDPQDHIIDLKWEYSQFQDLLTGQNNKFQWKSNTFHEKWPPPGNRPYMYKQVESIRDRVYNAARNKMLAGISTYFTLHRVIPGLAKSAPRFFPGQYAHEATSGPISLISTGKSSDWTTPFQISQGTQTYYNKVVGFGFSFPSKNWDQAFSGMWANYQNPVPQSDKWGGYCAPNGCEADLGSFQFHNASYYYGAWMSFTEGRINLISPYHNVHCDGCFNQTFGGVKPGESIQLITEELVDPSYMITGIQYGEKSGSNGVTAIQLYYHFKDIMPPSN